MKIQWLSSLELEVFLDSQKENPPKKKICKIKQGAVQEIDILQNKMGVVDIQFSDGTIAYDISKDSFFILE